MLETSLGIEERIEESMEERRDFFISYARRDLAWAEKIDRHLSALGYRTVLDSQRFAPGKSLAGEIDQALRQTRCVILLLSPAYFQSDHTTAEWQAGWARDPRGIRGKLWPIRIRPVEIESDLLKERIYTDLVDCDEEVIPAVLSAAAASVQSLWQDPAAVVSKPSPLPDREPLPFHSLPRLSAHLPPGSRMVVLEAPANFFGLFGRDSELLSLAKQLSAGDDSDQGRILAVAITGSQGAGKTQVAREFVYRFGSSFSGGVFWLSFAVSESIPDEVAQCAKAMGLGPNPRDQLIEEVRRVWTRPEARLLVFDNCEDPWLLERWSPPYGGCRILVTSRFSPWEGFHGVLSLPLEELEVADSISMLKSYPRLGRTDATVLGAIAEELGRNPLALHLAGSFLSRYQEEPQAYLCQIKNRLRDHPSMHGRGSPEGTDIVRAFNETLARASTEDAPGGALRILVRASFLAPGELIPHDLMLAIIGLDEAPSEERWNAFDAIGRLSALGLLQQMEDGSVVHRLISRLVRESSIAVEAADGIRPEEVVEKAVLRKLRAFTQSEIMPPAEWLPHLRLVVDRARPRSDDLAAGLSHSLGFLLMESESPAEARPYFERALSIWQKLGPDALETAQIYSNMGEFFVRQGNTQAALQYFRSALRIQKKLLVREDPQIAQTLNNLGLALKKQGRFASAQRSYRLVLNLRRRVHGPLHLKVAEALNNLGVLAREVGRLGTARNHYEEALAIREVFLGTDSPLLAQSHLNLGIVHLLGGDLPEARRQIQHAFEIRRENLGPGHADTARASFWMGHLLQRDRDLTGARRHFKDAWNVLQATLGPDHEDTARAREYYEAAAGDAP